MRAESRFGTSVGADRPASLGAAGEHDHRRLGGLHERTGRRAEEEARHAPVPVTGHDDEGGLRRGGGQRLGGVLGGRPQLDGDVGVLGLELVGDVVERLVR